MFEKIRAKCMNLSMHMCYRYVTFVYTDYQYYKPIEILKFNDLNKVTLADVCCKVCLKNYCNLSLQIFDYVTQ